MNIHLETIGRCALLFVYICFPWMFVLAGFAGMIPQTIAFVGGCIALVVRAEWSIFVLMRNTGQF